MTFQKIDMKLVGHSDAGYMNNPKAHSIAKGHAYMLNSSPFPPNNGSELTISKIIKTVIPSIVEEEIAALFINAREDLYMRKMPK